MPSRVFALAASLILSLTPLIAQPPTPTALVSEQGLEISGVTPGDEVLILGFARIARRARAVVVDPGVDVTACTTAGTMRRSHIASQFRMIRSSRTARDQNRTGRGVKIAFSPSPRDRWTGSSLLRL